MKKRKPIIAANWKMNKTCKEASNFAKELTALTENVKDKEIIIAPPFTSIFILQDIFKESKIIKLAGQNLYFEKEGAYTGEISADMLKSCGASFVIIGHSERRVIFKETDEEISKKIKRAFQSNLIPILCVGESEKEREMEKTFDVLDKQVKMALEDVSLNDLEKIIIAYEPVWAIGTGKVASIEQANEVHKFLRNLLEKRYSLDISNLTRIIYGGSVSPSNISSLMKQEDIDGVLVGGASLKITSFKDIINFN